MSPKVRVVKLNNLRKKLSRGGAVNHNRRTAVEGGSLSYFQTSTPVKTQLAVQTNVQIKERKMTHKNGLDESEDSDSTYINKFSERGTHLPFGLLPPITKEVISYMEALLQYMKEVYRAEGEASSVSPTEYSSGKTEERKVAGDIKFGGDGKVEIYPDSRCYISKSKMTAILLRADEDPENWTKIVRAILEEVYGKDLANLSAKGTRGSQGIYVPLYNALFALVNERLRYLNKCVSDHEFTKRINKICSNMRGAVKRTSSAANSSMTNTVRPPKMARTVPSHSSPSPNVQYMLSPERTEEDPLVVETGRFTNERRTTEVTFNCADEESSEECSVMMPVDVELDDTGEVEVFPQSQCFISKSKMSAILLRADEDPDNWVKLTRYILEEVYGEDLANLSAKGTRGSQGIYTPLYNSIYTLVNDRLRMRNKSVSEHEFNKRINKICSNKRGAVKRAATKRTDFIPAGLVLEGPYMNETDDEGLIDEFSHDHKHNTDEFSNDHKDNIDDFSYDHKHNVAVNEMLKNKSELIVTTR